MRRNPFLSAAGLLCLPFLQSLAELPHFGSPATIASQNRPALVWSGDLNGDGVQDAIAISETGELQILLGKGDGTFLSTAVYSLADSITGLAVGDWDGDGRADLAVTGAGGIRILKGDGNGGFSVPRTVALKGDFSSVVTADFDRDGKSDLAVTDKSGLVWYLRGRGDGTFGEARSFVTGGSAQVAAAGNLDGDGRPDLAVATDAGVSILLSSGEGFGAPKIIPTSKAVAGISLVDLNGDRRLDIVTLDAGGVVNVFEGDGAGGFSPPSKYPASVGSLLVSDVDGDGVPDVLVADPANESVLILRGKPDGTLAAPTEVALGTRSTSAASVLTSQVKFDGLLVASRWGGAVQFIPLQVRAGASTAAVSHLETSAGAIPALATSGVGIRPESQSASSVVLAATPNPSTFGKTVTLTASVSPPQATGKVTFYDGTAVVGIATLASGKGTYTTPLLAAGARSLSVRYGGDSNYLGSVSTTVTETINAVAGSALTAGASYLAGLAPVWIAVADFNRDNVPDLAVTTAFGVSIMLGNGDGTFRSPLGYATGTGPYAVAVGDFNGDGKPDLAVTNSGDFTTNPTGNLSILLGNGDGTFQTAVSYAADSAPSEIAVGDFNLDGKVDLAVANSLTSDVSVFLGKGDGTFNTAVNYSGIDGASALVVGDFNRDGHPDLAVAATDGTSVTILTGNGSGGFSTGAVLTVGNFPTEITAADFNNDGKLDLAVTNSGDGTLSVLIGNGDGTFHPQVLYNTGTSGSSSGPSSVTTGDVNGDGKIDIVVTNLLEDDIGTLLGNGDGTFRAVTVTSAADSPNVTVVEDFNGDGVADMAFAAYGDPNTGSGSQVGTLLSAGGGIIVPCTYSIVPTSLTYDQNGGLTIVTVTASGSNCSWTAASNVSWTTLTSSGGSGSGYFYATITTNGTGAERTGSISVAGQTVSIDQKFTTQIFSDVPPTAYYFDAVNLMFQKGITSGCTTTTYCPNDNVTRAQMAIFLVRAVYGSDNFSYLPTQIFTDVPPSAFGYKWIQALSQLGITSGCTATTFCPNNSVSRDQMAAFLIRMRYGPTTSVDYPPAPYFADVPTSYWDFGSIQRMKEDAITSGCTATTYCPTSTVTRGDMSLFIIRAAFNQLLPAGTPVISLVSPSTAAVGSTITVNVTGYNTSFAAGSSIVSSVPGITAGTAFVSSPTSLSVPLTIGASVPQQPVAIRVITGAEEAVLPNGLTIQ